MSSWTPSSSSSYPMSSHPPPQPPGFIQQPQPQGQQYQPMMSNPYPGGYGQPMANPYPNSNYSQPTGPMYTSQPGVTYTPAGVWIPVPAPIDGVTPGLEYLTMVDTVVIQQVYEVLELLTSWESKNRYSLKNANGEQVYFAAEESECCERQCCGPQRGFTIHIVDNFKREVITLRRPFKCCGGTFSCLAGIDCCAQECTIESPPGNVIGSVVQRPTCCSTGFHVKDADGRDIFRIEGPCCCLLIGCQDKEFPVVSMNGNHVGAITKKWGGCFREAFTDADVFRVTFPMDLDVKMKAILLGATFLIDFMAFEQQQNSNNNSSSNF